MFRCAEVLKGPTNGTDIMMVPSQSSVMSDVCGPNFLVDGISWTHRFDMYSCSMSITESEYQ